MLRFAIVGDLGCFSTTSEINKWPNDEGQTRGNKRLKIYPILIQAGLLMAEICVVTIFPPGACQVNTS